MKNKKIFRKVNLLRNLILNWWMHCLGSSSLLRMKWISVMAHAEETLDNLDFSISTTQWVTCVVLVTEPGLRWHLPAALCSVGWKVFVLPCSAMESTSALCVCACSGSMFTSSSEAFVTELLYRNRIWLIAIIIFHFFLIIITVLFSNHVRLFRWMFTNYICYAVQSSSA